MRDSERVKAKNRKENKIYHQELKSTLPDEEKEARKVRKTEAKRNWRARKQQEQTRNSSAHYGRTPISLFTVGVASQMTVEVILMNPS